MKAFYYLMFCAAFMLTACDNENGNGDDGNKEIILADGTPEEVVVKADDNGNGQAIKFTAVAPWTATVKDVTPTKAASENEVEWVTLSAYEGEAGEVSLSLSFTKNLTGATRKAEIIIQCGSTTIKITIEQVAENADGTVTKQVKTMGIRYEYNSETVGNTGGNPIAESTATFSYDDKGRVVKVTSIDEDGSNYTFETIYDYTIVNEIQITSREYHSGDTYEDKYIADLNDKGNAVRVRKSVEGKYVDKNTIEYSEEGRITRIREYDDYNELEEEINYSYNKDGYLIKAVVEDRYDDSDTEEYNFNIPTFYPNKYPNNNLIDMMSFYADCPFVFDDESISMLSTIGRLGKTGDYFIERIVKNKYFPGITYPDLSPTFENQTTTTTSEYISFENSIVSCEYDNDKNLTKVTITEPFKVYERTYHFKSIKVNNDTFEWELTNREDKEKGADKDITTYTLNY